MSFRLNLFNKNEPPSPRCIASVGNGVVCGRESSQGESLCRFHLTLIAPWLKAATKRAA